jgi:N-acetyl-anhydromuramyl-L-alanine amidase AmpD
VLAAPIKTGRSSIIMRLLRRLAPPALMLAFVSACASAPDTRSIEPEGEVAQMIARAAEANEVPVELMIAIAHIEGGLKLAPVRDVDEDELIPIAGALELRRGRFNSLARGAELMGRSELELSVDTALGTEAGARVLDDLARGYGLVRRESDIGAWAPVVEELSGHRGERERVEYRARVYKLLRSGGRLPARGGEVITLPPRDDVPVWLTLAPPLLGALDVSEYQGPGGPESVIWFETPSNNKWTAGREAAVSMIAIHDTEGGWDASVATLQNDGEKSCHYIVDADGSRVGQFVHEWDTAWHVGNWYYNSRMIGVEHVGYSGLDDYQTAMYERSGELVKDIAARHGLPVDRTTFIAHQEVPNGNLMPQSSPPCSDSPGSCINSGQYGGAGHHTDPGVYWEWCQYMEIAGGKCKCSDAYELWNCVFDLSMMVRCSEGAVEIVHCSDACVVEPLGVNDHCTPAVASGSTGTGAGGSGVSSASGASGAGVGAGGSSGEGGSASGGGGDTGEDSSCAVAKGNLTPARGTGGTQTSAGLLGGLVMAAARRLRAARYRRRRRERA